MYDSLLSEVNYLPEPYENTGRPFWDDEHISASMLAAHLDPCVDAASRKHSFIASSAQWIASHKSAKARVLDLGCGPGLYAQEFAKLGLAVTGLDISHRSIKYAKNSAVKHGFNIEYICADYVKTEYAGSYDIAILIYCDYGVLPPESRKKVLQKTFSALRPGGLFFVDVFTPQAYTLFKNGITAQTGDNSFWSAGEYLEIKRQAEYHGHLYLERYNIVQKQGINSYNLWNQAFTPENLEKELKNAGFNSIKLYSDAAGRQYNPKTDTLCAVVTKLG